MNLYRYNKVINVIPGRDANDAAFHYEEATDINGSEAKDFELVVPHEDFIRLFRLARTLVDNDQYTSDNISSILLGYALSLGYNLTLEEVIEGIVVWAERFIDMDDEDIEDWIL